MTASPPSASIDDGTHCHVVGYDAPVTTATRAWLVDIGDAVGDDVITDVRAAAELGVASPIGAEALIDDAVV